ncbi:hypothetical protein, partial [Paenibacillus gallinarum]
NDSEKLNSKNEQQNVSVSENTNNEQTNDSVNLNSKNESKSISVLENKTNEQANDSDKLNSKSKSKRALVQEENDFLSQYELLKRNRKPRVEDTHTRDTYLIRNDLLARFNKLAEKQEKGFKMRMVNYLLEKELDKIEKRQGGIL